MDPHFVTWAESLSTKTVGEDLFFWPSRNCGPKTGLNLSGDLFLFWSSPNFRQENKLGFGIENFYSGLHYSQYSQIFWPLPFENPAYATADMLLYLLVLSF